MLFVVIMGTVWSVVIATDTGVRNIPPIYARAARTMGSSGLHKWTKVILPASLPYLVSGMKQGWAFAWRSLMAAEIYVTILTGFGLGHLLHYGRELHAMDQVIGVMLVIVLIGLLTDKIVFAPIERFLHRRWGLGARSCVIVRVFHDWRGEPPPMSPKKTTSCARSRITIGGTKRSVRMWPLRSSQPSPISRCSMRAVAPVGC